MAMSREAEIAVLSACLADNRAFFEANARISAADFEHLDLAELWRHALVLFGKQQPVGMTTMIDRVRHDEALVRAWKAVVAECYSPSNAATYADAVRSASLKRRVAALAGVLSGEAKRGDLSGDEIVASALEAFSVLQKRVAASAQRFSDAYVATEAAIRETRDRRNRGELTGAPTGITGLDEALGGIAGAKLIILAARPSVGKTAVANLAAVNMARHGFPGAVFSLEMSTDQLVARALAAEAGVNVTALSRGEANTLDVAAHAYVEHIGDIPLWIDTDTYDLARICAQAAMLRHKHAITWIIVDHIGLVETAQRFGTRNDQMGHISRTLKQLAKRLGIPVIALSQLSRECEREQRKPNLSDLRDSGNLEQDADQVIFLHSPYDTPRGVPRRGLEFGLLKNRGGRCGWIGGYEFEGATQRVLRVVHPDDAVLRH
jgi:replicative DNA helicase